jgi:hypothetical protein
MAEALNLQITLKVAGALTNALDLSTPTQAFATDYSSLLIFGNGTGANQANMLWHDQRSVTTSGEDIDLAGSLTSAFGTTITFAVVKGVIVVAATANGGNVVVARASSNGVGVFNAASDAVTLKPGGVFLWTDPSAAGTTVTAGTGDLLNIDSTSGTVTYDIWLVGEV